MALIRRMRHIHLKVADVERAARFYEQGLGMERVMTKHDGQMIVLATPGADEAFTLSEGSVGADVDAGGRIGESGGIDHFGFSLADQNRPTRRSNTSWPRARR